MANPFRLRERHTMKKFIAYSFGTIALYLVVVNGSNSGTLIKDSTAGGTNLVKAFQGR